MWHVPGALPVDPHDDPERDQDPADHYSGKRHAAAALTGLPDLVQRDQAEDQPQQGPNDAKPSEQGAHQRRHGHPVRGGAWRRRLVRHGASWSERHILYSAC
jgi:hypothetical protein